MNKVILIGNLTKDPELTETPTGLSVCRFSIAVTRDYTNSDGTREADFFNITVWNKIAEICGKYLRKGTKVAVTGRLQNRSYEDKEGVKRTVTDIIASEVEFLTPKSQQGDEVDATPVRRERPVLEAIDDNQLPF
jgi:single-strand DNA-binding protein